MRTREIRRASLSSSSTTSIRITCVLSPLCSRSAPCATFPVKTLMDRKGSSHVGSPDYNAEITPQGGELAIHPRKLSGGHSAMRHLEALLESGPRGSGIEEVTV